jgi:DNA primase
MISQKTIDEIFNVVQVEDVVGDFVHLKKRGNNLLGLCPFHDEKTPSFTVSPSKNIYKCFGCGRGGNSVQFMMEHEQLSYPETLRALAEKYNIPIEEENVDAESLAKKETRESLYIINQLVNEYYQDQLFNTDMGKSVGLSYFKKRSFPEHILKTFGLGFSPAGGRTFTEYAAKAGLNSELLRELGLTTEKGNDFFRNRVMFPIHNVHGKVIAFAGRSLSEDKRSPKYINSPESEIYNKSWVLYGLHLAKKSIIKSEECILVEGYTDVISMHLQGVDNVVASSGTALTEGQIKLIKRYTPNVLILYDGDPAGIKAALRGVDLLLSRDMNVKIALLPQGHDPDSFIRDKGESGFRAFIKDNAQDFILFKSNLLLEEAKNDPIRTTNLIKDIVDSIAKIPDALKRSLFIKQCAERFDLSEELLIDTLNKSLKVQAVQNRKREAIPPVRPGDRDRLRQVKGNKAESDELNDETQERDIVRILLRSGHELYPSQPEITVADYLISNLADIIDNFDNDLYRRVIIEYSQAKDKNGNLDSRYFVNHTDKDFVQLAVDLLSEKYIYSENWSEKHEVYLSSQKDPEKNFESECTQGLLRLKFRKINKLIKENSASIEQFKSNNEDTKMINALKIHDRLVKQRNQVAKMMNQVIV